MIYNSENLCQVCLPHSQEQDVEHDDSSNNCSRYGWHCVSGNWDDKEICNICQEYINQSKMVTKCNHSFHIECYKKLF